MPRYSITRCSRRCPGRCSRRCPGVEVVSWNIDTCRASDFQLQAIASFNTSWDLLILQETVGDDFLHMDSVLQPINLTVQWGHDSSFGWQGVTIDDVSCVWRRDLDGHQCYFNRCCGNRRSMCLMVSSNLFALGFEIVASWASDSAIVIWGIFAWGVFSHGWFAHGIRSA